MFWWSFPFRLIHVDQRVGGTRIGKYISKSCRAELHCCLIIGLLVDVGGGKSIR